MRASREGNWLFCLWIVEPPWWGSSAPLALRSVVPFRGPGSPQFLLLLLAQVPWQEQFDVPRDLAPGRRAVLEVPRQPLPGVEPPQRQRGEDRERRCRQLATPERTRAVEVL